MDERAEKRVEADLLRAAGEAGRGEVLARLFEEHRPRLDRMVALRMDPRMRARLGASDVLQDAYVEIARRIGDWLEDPSMPFFLWVRFIAAQRLQAMHRHHLGAKMRDARRQVSAHRADFPDATGAALVDHLVSSGTTPTQALARGEVRLRLAQALDAMNPADREVLVLRHFEELSNAETARELGLETSAASKRYLRALKRLKEVLAAAETGSP
jgi:RNA polymerase sigma-70 factor (ECF subfamily)